MPIYGWDASHYDGALDTATLVKAKSEGIAFFSHKLGEGTGNVDTTAKTALSAARAAGIPVIGAYWFCHNSDDPVAEADRMIARADADEPWWRTFPGWFWQADCETETGQGKPSASWIKKFANRLVARTSRVCIVYASHGEYGDTLDGIGHPLWNANYPSSRQAGFRSLYPGDSYSGWAKYSGQIPVLCQFTSSAEIGGLGTCDANAFRGSTAQLLTLIGAPAPQPAEDEDMPTAKEIVAELLSTKLGKGDRTVGQELQTYVAQDAATEATAALKKDPTFVALLADVAAIKAAVTVKPVTPTP